MANKYQMKRHEEIAASPLAIQLGGENYLKALDLYNEVISQQLFARLQKLYPFPEFAMMSELVLRMAVAELEGLRDSCEAEYQAKSN